MSLPPATKEISSKPGKNSVVEPINRRQKEHDVDRKLRFYGVITALRQGRMPSNAQLDRALEYLVQSEPVPTKKLSHDGQTLVGDVRDMLETLRAMLKEKNGDELIQQFAWHTRDVDVEQAKKSPSDVLPVDKEKATADGQQAARHLRTLLALVLTNSEARKLAGDASVLGRDLLARGAAKAAEGLRPDEERLARVDDSAPQDQFVTEGGQTMGPNDGTPVPEVRVPVPGKDGDVAVAKHPDGAAKVETLDGEVKSGAQVKEDAMTKKEEAKDAAKREASDVQATTDGESKDASKQTMKDKLKGYRDNISGKIPDEHKDRARDQRDRAKKFLTEDYFPEERRDQFIFRMKKVIIECQKHNDYQESIRWLLGYVEEYAQHGKTVATAGKDSGSQVTSDPAVKLATNELRTVLERFANNQSMEPIFIAVNNLIDDARNDEELRGWFTRVDTFVRKILLEPGFVLEPACNTQARDLRESGRRFYDEKYKSHFDTLFTAVGDFFRAMGDDPLNKRFGQDWARLTKDLLFDSEGSLKFKPQLWNDVRAVIMPALVDKVGYIPIPRIEYSDAQLDMVIENLTLSGKNLFPNIIAMEAHNFLKFSPYQNIKDEQHHEFTLTLAQVQADMRDVAFYFRKKTGFPKLQDSGLADVLLGGEGLTATIHLISADKDPSSVFKVKAVNVKVDTLKFSIRDSKHDLLYKTLKPLATGLVKKQIQKAIADSLTTGLEYVDGQLVGVRDRMAEAKVADDTSRTEVLKQMFQSKKETAKVEGEKRASKFNVVSKRDSLLLPGTGSPAGWINRANESAEKASTGQEWRSEAFTIV